MLNTQPLVKVLCSISFFLSALLGPLDSVSAGGPSRTTMNIVSMNIHCFKDNWEFRLQHILDKFIELSADVIGLQEVCEDPKTHESQIDYIKKYLNDHNYPVQRLESQYTHPAWDKYNEYLVLISKWEVLNVDKGLLPESQLQRAYIAFNINQNWYINTHLEYKAENAVFRAKQIDFLRQHFARLPHLIGGDFNSSPDTPEQLSFGRDGYQKIFPGDSVLQVDSDISRRIDGFWLSPEFLQNRVVSDSYVFLNQKVQDQFLSDHFAIFAQLIPVPFDK